MSTALRAAATTSHSRVGSSANVFHSASSSNSSSTAATLIRHGGFNLALFGFGSTLSNEDEDKGLQCTSVVSRPLNVAAPAGIPSRSEQVASLQKKNNEYDVLVVGAGATGAGIALDAAARGLRVACVERGDFSSETSSRSTKLIWAGLKYLGTAVGCLLSSQTLSDPMGSVTKFRSELRMIYHCHTERRYMTDKQKHLCTWMPIVVPFTSWYLNPPPLGHPLFSVFPIVSPVVFKVYDALSCFSCPHSYVLTKSKAAEVFPQLRREDLKYASVFYEAQHNDARTNIAIALTAAQYGAHICNYVEMVDLLQQEEGSKRVVGAKVVDRTTGKSWDIRAKHVVLAGGPFTDALRKKEMNNEEERKSMTQAVRNASGTHIMLPGSIVPPNIGLLDYRTSDGRFMFMLPWLGHTLVGTTEIKDVAETSPRAPQQDISYLLTEAKRYLNHSTCTAIQQSNVSSSWRGWRPLAADPHAEPDAPASRDHVISVNPATGVMFIAGGKWTTWREMAQEVVDRMAGGKACTTLNIGLWGADGYSDHLAERVREKYSDLDETVAKHLVSTYGGLVWDVLSVSDDKRKKCVEHKRLAPGFPYLEDEVVYACREYACTIEDVLSRRTRLAFVNHDAAMKAIPRVANIMANELGWTGSVKRAQIKAAKKYVSWYKTDSPEIKK